jgi:transcriptional regulator with XRE-family HTH domain
MPDPWDAQMEALGAFIRSQRHLARLSLRQMAELTSLSNPYLSQVERGRHQPSVRVLKLIAEALNVSAETLLEQAGLLDGQGTASGSGGQVEAAIRTDERLSEEQKAALIAVYHSMAGE